MAHVIAKIMLVVGSALATAIGAAGFAVLINILRSMFLAVLFQWAWSPNWMGAGYQWFRFWLPPEWLTIGYWDTVVCFVALSSIGTVLFRETNSKNKG